MIRQPDPKPDVMARRDSIVAGLRALLPESGLIAEALRLKPYDGRLVPGGDPAAEAGVGGVDAGVDDVDRAVLAVVGDAQGPQVVQADDRAGGRAGQAGGGLELPDPVVVGGVEGGAVGREGDAQARAR